MLKKKRPYAGFIFVSIIAMIFFTLTYYLLKDQWRIEHKFLQTTCTILDKRLNSYLSKGSTMYSSSFYVSYMAGQKAYKRWVPDKVNSGSSSFYNYESGILNSYTKNQQYTCWYDPDVPGVAVLNKGYSMMLDMLIIFDALLVFIIASLFRK